MVAPAAAQLGADFGITNSAILAMTISVFVLAYGTLLASPDTRLYSGELALAFGPLFLGPLSELYGRSRVLQLANLFFLIFNIAAGFAQTSGQLIAFRFLSGLGGSAPLAVRCPRYGSYFQTYLFNQIGGGVLGDCWHPEQRGKAIAVYSLAPLLGPVVGPVAGAWIATKSTWRWVVCKLLKQIVFSC